MQPLLIIFSDKFPDACSTFRYCLIAFCINLFILQVLQNRSMKILSITRPLPSMLIFIFFPRRIEVNSRLVNCVPWSVLKYTGFASPRASFKASQQKSAKRQYSGCNYPSQPPGIRIHASTGCNLCQSPIFKSSPLQLPAYPPAFINWEIQVDFIHLLKDPLILLTQSDPFIVERRPAQRKNLALLPNAQSLVFFFHKLSLYRSWSCLYFILEIQALCSVSRSSCTALHLIFSAHQS